MRLLSRGGVVCLLAVGVVRVGTAQEVEIRKPRVFLRGVPFTLTVGAPEVLEPVSVRIVSADGAVMASKTLAPYESHTFDSLTVENRTQLPLRVVVADAPAQTVDGPLIPAWFSILPPVVAIAMALIFREVVASLFLGVWLGAFFVAGYNPLTAILETVEEYAMPALADTSRASIVIFSLLLGGMVGVLNRMGAARAIVDKVSSIARTPRSGQLSAWLAGLAIFFDDYANTLIVGNTMRPLTDRLKVSREKLAYIVDSTAAPVAAIFFVSTWIGYEVSLIDGGLQLAASQHVANPTLTQQLTDVSAFGVFLRTIPFLFYPFLAIAMVLTVILTRRDFGPMLHAERRAATGGGVFRPGAQLAQDVGTDLGESPEGKRSHWLVGALPVVAVVITVLLGLYHTGLEALDPGEERTLSAIINNADPFVPLLWGSLLGCVLAILLSMGQRVLSLTQAVEALVGGIRSMVMAIIILVLAWSLGDVTNALNTASYLAGVLAEGLPTVVLPSLVFLVAAGMAFATGTSWGTMAILLPLVVPLAVTMAVGQEEILQSPGLLGAIASVLAGSIWGDHCSPISDTTVMSSMASGCDHVDHVRTQLPYALVAGLAAILFGTLPAAMGVSPWILLPIGVATVWLSVRVLGRPARTDSLDSVTETEPGTAPV